MRDRISDSIPCVILLALSGGCMDAYSYLFRDHVFANAQTGNMLLFGVNLANGDISGALKYFWLILAFTIGIILSDIMTEKKVFQSDRRIEYSVIFEALVLAAAAFIPKRADAVANIMISFVCGIQLETFRDFHGNKIATTMCIGNLRSGTYNLDKYINTRERPYLRKAMIYYGIILSFISGAIIESKMIKLIEARAIWFSSVMLIACAIVMFCQSAEKGAAIE